MSALVQRLFPPPAYRRTPLGLLRWWEARRPFYNLVVGASGLFSLAVVELLALLPPGPHHFLPLVPVVVFGLAANVCYSLGFLVEAALEGLWGREAPLVGPALFRQGLSFSVGLTLLPMAIAGIGWVGRILAFLGWINP